MPDTIRGMTIRRLPDDFVVRERLTDRLVRLTAPAFVPKSTPFALYELEKTSLTTPESVQRLAGLLKTKPSAIEHAGLKDKHAHTYQHVTVACSTLPKDQPVPDHVAGPGLAAQRIGFVPEHIRAADIDANRFAIIVRDISRPAADDMPRRAAHLNMADAPSQVGRRLLVMNYFGDQRFGSARHGAGWVAEHLIKGEFEQAIRLAVGTPARKDTGKKREFTRLCASHWGDWKRLASELPRCPERAALEVLAAGGHSREAFAALPYFTQQICVEAFQSHLWNATARRLADQIARATSPNQQPMLLHADDPFGAMLFPHATAISPDWLALQLPMLAPATQATPPWNDAARSVLAEHRLQLSDLRIPGMRRPAFGEADRPLFVHADHFTLSSPEHDELSGGKRLKVILNFDLPRGAYATVLLRALGQ